MKTSMYKPKPIDTSDIQLPAELDELVEKMSENVHDLWASARISQGWKYGKKRNDKEKTHPCLVPYNDLPEVGTLKLILKLGFKINR